MTLFLKQFKNYCYDQNYNFFHNTYEKLIPITRKEYKKKTGESDYIINKLVNGVWSSQNHNYFFYKIGEKYVPIDWKLINILKFFHIFHTNISHYHNHYTAHLSSGNQLSLPIIF